MMAAMLRGVFFLLAISSFLTQSASASPTANYCESVLNEPGISVQNCGGLHLVRLSGSPLVRARHMGELVKRGILSSEVIQYFTHKVSNVVEEKAGAASAMILAVYHQLVRLFHRGGPAKIQEEVDAMAHAMEMDPIILRR